MAEEGCPFRILTWHPCDYLIGQILNAFACCFGLCDSFCPPRDSSQEEEEADGTEEEGADGTDEPTVCSPSLSLFLSLCACRAIIFTTFFFN